MGSTTIHIPLSPLDHGPPRNYSNSVLYLPLRPGVNAVEAYGILQDGLHRTFFDLPWLSGKVYLQSPDALDWRPGQLEIRHDPVDLNGPRPYQLKFNELDASIDYDELKASAFPTDTFKDESLIWAPFMPDINNGPEVFIAQANFIPGACLLTGALYHAAGDGVAYSTIVKLWAENCNALQLQNTPQFTVPLASSDRTLPEQIWAREGTGKAVSNIDPGIWRLLGLDPTTTLKPIEAPKEHVIRSEEPKPTATSRQRAMKSGIFYISSPKFATLQKECSQELGDTSRASGNDIISALIWRCLLKARSMAASKVRSNEDIADPEARMDMILDGRADFSQSLPPTYLGNVTLTIQSCLPLSILTSPDTSIASVARTIRNAATSVNSANLLDMYTLVRNLPDFNQLSVRKRQRQLGFGGFNMLITSLLMFPLNDSSFGDRTFGNSGKPHAFRPLMGAFNRLTRICFILPRNRNGGVEFVANLFEDEMALLLEDDEFGKYAISLS